MDFGTINGHVLGIIMKEVIRRAIVAIRQRRLTFVVYPKPSDSGKPNDLWTDADKEAQKKIVIPLQQGFPRFGIVAEEENLRQPCTLADATLFFTVDPLDGSKAFVRRQFDGVGTMLALVLNDQVIAAYIGNVNTGEIFGFRPEKARVYRITDLDQVEVLEFKPDKPFSENFSLLIRPLATYSAPAQRLIGLTSGHLINNGSIGITFAKLWIGECAMMILPPNKQKPWDFAPVYGISRQLGFEFFLLDPQTGALTPFRPKITPETFRTELEMVIIHPTHLAQLPTTR